METSNNQIGQMIIETELFVVGTEPEPSEELLEMLGCVSFQSIAKFVSGDRLPIARMPTAYTCLLSLTKAMMARVQRGASSFSSVLAGMLTHCSEGKPASAEHAYDLAIVSLLFTETYTADYNLDALVADMLCGVLNAWIKPETPIVDVPGVGVLSRHLFGDPWRCLFVPDHLENSVGHALFGTDQFIGDLVWQQRPPLLPGLCPGQSNQMSVPLPSLDMTS
jgi:hypothetical protein